MAYVFKCVCCGQGGFFGGGGKWLCSDSSFVVSRPLNHLTLPGCRCTSTRGQSAVQLQLNVTLPDIPPRAAGDQMKDADVGLLAASTSLVWSDFSERLMIKSMRHLSKARERERQNIFRVEVYRLDCRGLAAATSVVSTFMLFLTISEPFLSLKAQKKKRNGLISLSFSQLKWCLTAVVRMKTTPRSL